MTDKQKLNIDEALGIIKQFCDNNGFDVPKIKIIDIKNKERACGLYNYKSKTITVFVKSCANVATNPGFAWSYPHYFVDRTVFGVLLHEFGHCIHQQLKWPKIPGGKRITSYEPNMEERFAETMKVFLSNPDLLKNYNEKRYNRLIELGLKPVIDKPWQEVLKDANPKYIEACHKRLNK